MQDNYLDDVTPPVHKRTIRDIPIPAHRQKRHARKSPDAIIRKKRVEKREEDDYASESESLGERNGSSNNGLNKIKFIYGPLVVIAIILVVFGMNLFSKAEVEIITKTESLANLNTSFAINTIEDLEGESEIPYQEINLQKTSSEEVLASGEEFVEEKASGVITIYNEYSSSPQTLVEKTRFESPDGKIYRIPESVTVPGLNNEDGGVKAGKIEVEVFADESGEDYNFGDLNARFNIPGFKGQDQYDVFYAKSKTAINGGYNGIKKIVSEEDLSDAKENLELEVKNMLEQEVEEQLPQNLLAIYNDSSFSFDDVKQKDDGSDKAVLELSGSLSLAAFDKITLAQKIAEDQLIDYRAGEEIEITNLDDIKIDLDLENQRITVSGDVEFRWKNDLEELRNDLAGAAENELRDIFGSYRGIVSVNTTISPFWKNKFPNNPNRIYIAEE